MLEQWKDSFGEFCFVSVESELSVIFTKQFICSFIEEKLQIMYSTCDLFYFVLLADQYTSLVSGWMEHSQ